jgi:hypothetical protein
MGETGSTPNGEIHAGGSIAVGKFIGKSAFVAVTVGRCTGKSVFWTVRLGSGKIEGEGAWLVPAKVGSPGRHPTASTPKIAAAIMLNANFLGCTRMGTDLSSNNPETTEMVLISPGISHSGSVRCIWRDLFSSYFWFYFTGGVFKKL